MLVLDAEQNNIDLAKYSDILLDPDNNYRIENIIQPPLSTQFRPTEASDLKVSPTTGRLWLRFTLRNNSDKTQQQLLQINPSNANYI